MSQNHYQLLLELNKLKQVFRNTATGPERQESSAEHSWSVAMIIVSLLGELRDEFGAIDELKVIKMALMHDVVEIYAGDAFAFDLNARKEKEVLEAKALQQFNDSFPEFGNELQSLWHEFEEKSSLEAKIAKAADALCPIFVRLQFKQSYIPIHITVDKLDAIKSPLVDFSKTYRSLFDQLKSDLLKAGLIE